MTFGTDRPRIRLHDGRILVERIVVHNLTFDELTISFNEFCFGRLASSHPALRVFDHGPGRQGGRSTESASTLLGRDRGGDQDREVPPFPEPIGGAIREVDPGSWTVS